MLDSDVWLSLCFGKFITWKYFVWILEKARKVKSGREIQWNGKISNHLNLMPRKTFRFNSFFTPYTTGNGQFIRFNGELNGL